jgi:hypothetical protein
LPAAMVFRFGTVCRSCASTAARTPLRCTTYEATPDAASPSAATARIATTIRDLTERMRRGSALGERPCRRTTRMWGITRLSAAGRPTGPAQDEISLISRVAADDFQGPIRHCLHESSWPLAGLPTIGGRQESLVGRRSRGFPAAEFCAVRSPRYPGSSTTRKQPQLRTTRQTSTNVSRRSLLVCWVGSGVTQTCR